MSSLKRRVEKIKDTIDPKTDKTPSEVFIGFYMTMATDLPAEKQVSQEEFIEYFSNLPSLKISDFSDTDWMQGGWAAPLLDAIEEIRGKPIGGRNKQTP